MLLALNFESKLLCGDSIFVINKSDLFFKLEIVLVEFFVAGLQNVEEIVQGL